MLLLLQILIAKLFGIMKLDKSPTSTPEKVANTQNAIIEIKTCKKNNPEDILDYSEGENQNKDVDIVVHFNRLKVNPIEEFIANTSNIVKNTNSVQNEKEVTALSLIDADLKRQDKGVKYKDVFTVDLGFQNVKLVEETISSKLTKLVVLNLSHNNLSELPDLLDFKCLKELDISHNQFVSVPVCLQISFSKLVNLDMSYNDIQTFDQPMCTHTLRKLFINNNKCMRIPEWFWYMEFYSLEELNMSFTRPFIETLPIWLLNYMDLKKRGVFTNIISLEVRNTAAFSTNMTQVQYLKNIKYLNCSNDLDTKNSCNINVFWEMPSSILELTTLQELQISSVQLNLIPENICNLVSLEVLNVSHNKIYRLPEAISSLKRLRELNVSFNNLLELPQKFGTISSLKIFHAQHNDIQHLPVGFQALNLIYCDLYNNELDEKCLPMIVEMKHLQCLDLMQNEINQNLVPLDLQQNLRDTMKKQTDRLSAPKVLQVVVEEPEEDSSDSHHYHNDNYSGYASFTSSQSQSPDAEALKHSELEQLQSAVSECSNSSNWDDEATHSDEYNFILCDDWQTRLPKNYDEAIETFRTRQRDDTCFIPGDTQIKFFKRKEPQRFYLLSRPVVPGQFDDAL